MRAPVVVAAGSGAGQSARSARDDLVSAALAAAGAFEHVQDSARSSAAAGSAAGRASMESVIAGAVADVDGLGLSLNTPAGKAALVAAVRRRLEETREVLGTGGADASTQAAAADLAGAGYNSVGLNPAAGAMMPAGGGGGMPMGGGGFPQMSPPSMGGAGGLAGLGGSALQALSGLGQPGGGGG
ncbi:hypothetical protein KIH27_22180, partial [Mycobacterium sp. M1]|nr:hypothetical protein [Mycolicibacter acidiphilus]